MTTSRGFNKKLFTLGVLSLRQPNRLLASLRVAAVGVGRPTVAPPLAGISFCNTLGATRYFFSMSLVALGMVVMMTGAGWAQDKDKDNFDYTVVKTKSGLTFRVPEDMPIQTRDGIEAPMPFDEYVYGKFKKMDTRLDRMEKTLERIESELKNLKVSDSQVKA